MNAYDHGNEQAPDLDPRVHEVLDAPGARADESVAGDVALQRRIDASLKRLEDGRATAPPALPSMESLGDAPAPVGFLGRVRPFAAAAALLLVASAAVFVAVHEPAERLNASTIYARTTVAFFPTVVCDTPEKFLDYTTEFLRTPIAADFSSPVEFVGWQSFSVGYTGEDGAARLLLARAPDGTEVVAIFQPASLGVPELDRADGLNRFGRTIGPIEVWEITPLDEPVVLDAVSAG